MSYGPCLVITVAWCWCHLLLHHDHYLHHYPNQQRWHAKCQLSWNTYALPKRVFACLAPICTLSRCLLTKFLQQSSGGSLLRVCCWLGQQGNTVYYYNCKVSIYTMLQKNNLQPEVQQCRNNHHVIVYIHSILVIFFFSMKKIEI